MGSARRYSNEGSVANRMEQDNKKQSAYARDNGNLYGYSTPGSSTQGLAPTNDKSKLSKIGGIMVGATGYKSNRTIIDTGVAKVDDELLTSTIGKTLIKIVGETAGGDTLDQLTGRKYEGQMAVLMNASSADTITITHGAGVEGQFLCPGSTDYALGPYQSCLIFHDNLFTLDTWRIIDQPISSSAGVLIGDSPTWTGSHTFNGTTQIFNGTGFQIGATTIVIGDSITDNLTINAKLQTAFLPDGNAIDLGDASNKWRNIYLNAGFNTSKIFFDGGGDTYLTGSGTSGKINVYSDGTVYTTFTVGGMSTTALSINGLVTMNNNNITMGSGDIDLSTGGRINFYDNVDGSALSSGGATALPALPTAYFTVEFRGATRYIPYYT